MRSCLMFGSLIFMGVLLSACSRVPIASNHVLTLQKKAKSAHHWDVLADDIASQISQAINSRTISVKNRFVVTPPDNGSSFNRAFNSFLIDRLVHHGITVTSDDNDASALFFEIQLIKHDSSRYTHEPGSLSFLASGLWVIRNASSYLSYAMPSYVFPALTLDAALTLEAGPQTHIELVVTSSIYENDHYVYRRSDIYYIEAEDVDLFREYIDLKVRPVEVTNK